MSSFELLRGHLLNDEYALELEVLGQDNLSRCEHPIGLLRYSVGFQQGIDVMLVNIDPSMLKMIDYAVLNARSGGCRADTEACLLSQELASSRGGCDAFDLASFRHIGPFLLVYGTHA
jgi:hypothetical protein